MTSEGPITLPEGRELNRLWKEQSRVVQGEMFRKIRRAEPGRDEEEALLIAAMSQHRLRGWTMRLEIAVPAFIAFFAVLSLVIENFSFSSALSAPIIYGLYVAWMRGVYKKAYRRNMEVLEGKPPSDA